MAAAGIFTEHVRLLARATPLPAEHFDALWQALRAVLVSELRKRSLWNVSPAYLGVYGADSWSRPEALEELLVECYSAAFLRRLRSLGAQLRARSSIDGMIFLNVRNFLHDTQKKHDPLGFRIFTVLRAAIRALIGDEVLRILAGDDGIRNDTIVGFHAGDPERRAPDGEIEDRARALGDVLLPDLITAVGKAQVKLIARLAATLCDWRQEGVLAFRFRELCSALCNDARGRWASVWQQKEGLTAREDRTDDVAALVRQVQPDSGFEERQSFHQLLACVEAALDRQAAGDTGSRPEDLRRLWLFLRNRVADAKAGEALPSRRKMATLLEIPRDRLGPLHASLGQLVEGCRAPAANQAANTATAPL